MILCVCASAVNGYISTVNTSVCELRVASLAGGCRATHISLLFMPWIFLYLFFLLYFKFHFKCSCHGIYGVDAEWTVRSPQSVWPELRLWTFTEKSLRILFVRTWGIGGEFCFFSRSSLVPSERHIPKDMLQYYCSIQSNNNIHPCVFVKFSERTLCDVLIPYAMQTSTEHNQFVRFVRIASHVHNCEQWQY